jgi:excinuclease ABC subunit C
MTGARLSADQIKTQLRAAPRSPGVYVMRDARGEILYIGKAKDLRGRVRSYFRAATDGRYQVQFLIDRIAGIEYLVTTSEKDALLLENNLIKKAKPKFNIRLRDDKSYVILRINVAHPWPRALVARGFRDDGALYFGPFSSADKLRNTMRALQRVFPLRLCTDHTLKNRTRPCVYYDIRMCSAPCVGLVPPATYRRYVDGLVLFMKGRNKNVLDDLRRRMQEAAESRRYEEAAELRDRIAAITLTVEKQRTEETGETYDRDVFGYHWEGEELAIQALFYRDGKLTHSSAHRFRALMPVRELLSSFLVQFYDGERMVPSEILLPVEIEDGPALVEWLSDKSGRRVRIYRPQRGDKLRQVELAVKNAAQALAEDQSERQRHAELLESLRDKLGLKNTPERIECYDISHFGGRDTVGSRVAFASGVADKSRYRRYRVRIEPRGDDFAALGEVLDRRLRRGIEEGDLPDLLIIDGGTGQLARVREVMNQLNLVDIDVIGLAKARRQRRGNRIIRTDERVVKDDLNEPIVLKQDSPENHFLIRVRDEAHRFAVTYHRKLKRRELVRSQLMAIPGIGPKRRTALLKHLGSIEAVRRATLDQLQAVPGFGPRAAERVIAYFRGAGKS